ncbi:hypothetical protein, partial [Salmonella sp. SAL4438]|uniref:hypothetical protein n=1 Tax=Salmonella sp. SAL4438 TaxID=3159893 RepID=UPI0039785CD7
LGTAVIAYGDDTQTVLREFDSTGAQLDSIVLSGIPFSASGNERGSGLNSLDDGRVLVASSPDLNSTTTSVTMTTVDFRTTGLNIDN